MAGGAGEGGGAVDGPFGVSSDGSGMRRRSFAKDKEKKGRTIRL